MFVACILTMVSGREVADVPRSRRGSNPLQQAIAHLVNYTTAEAEERLDINRIGSTVAAIAYQKLKERLGRSMSIVYTARLSEIRI